LRREYRAQGEFVLFTVLVSNCKSLCDYLAASFYVCRCRKTLKGECIPAIFLLVSRKNMPQSNHSDFCNLTLADDGRFTLVFRENSGVDPDGSRKTRVNCPSSVGVLNSYPQINLKGIIIKMQGFKITEVNPGLFLIKDILEVNMYLIVGSEKALLFDTGYGIYDLHPVIESITDKPITVILGHGHIDHANGAYQFDEVYMREEDNELLAEHTSKNIRDSILERMKEEDLPPGFDREKWSLEGACNVKPLKPGEVFDLGGKTVEVIDMAAHTGGSIGVLLREDRILLDSDSANTHCWIFVPQSLSLREYIAMLERVKALDFDVFYVAHQDYAHPKSDFDKFIKAAKNAKIENSKPYDSWEELNPYIYTEDGASIVFNERTLA